VKDPGSVGSLLVRFPFGDGETYHHDLVLGTVLARWDATWRKGCLVMFKPAGW
jgi:hypothetical protein